MPAAKTTKDAAKTIETFTADAQKSMTEQFEKLAKSFEDVAAFNQETVEALVASGNVAAKAAEEINAEFVAYSKKAVEDGVAAAKEISSAKSVTEFVEKQAAYTKSSFDGFVKQANKFGEMYAAATKSAFEPVSARFTAAADMVKTYQA